MDEKEWKIFHWFTSLAHSANAHTIVVHAI